MGNCGSREVPAVAVPERTALAPSRPKTSANASRARSSSSSSRASVGKVAAAGEPGRSEEEWREVIRAEDLAAFGSNEPGSAAAAAHSAQLGVTIEYLLEFTARASLSAFSASIGTRRFQA